MLQPVPNVQAVQWFDRSRSLTAGFLDGLQFRALSRNHHERLGLPLVLSIKLRTGSEFIEGYAPFQTFKNRFGWRPFGFRVTAHAHEFSRAWSFCVWCHTMLGIRRYAADFFLPPVQRRLSPGRAKRWPPGAACSKSDPRNLGIRDG